MAEAAEGGRPVTSVLEKYPTYLYPWHLGVLRAAETVGALPEAFGQIAQAYEDEWKTRTQVALHTTFYVIMYLPCVFLILPFLKFFDAPIPKEGWELGTMVQYLLREFHRTSLPLAEACLALVVLWFVLSTMAWFQRAQQWVVLGIPLAGRVVRMAALDRYLSTLSMMLRAGIPLSRGALRVGLRGREPAAHAAPLGDGGGIGEGARRSFRRCTATRVFSGDVLQLAAAGEVAGSLPEMLGRAAEMYRVEHQRLRKMLLTVGLALAGAFWVALSGYFFIKLVLGWLNFEFRVGDWAGE